MSNTSLNLDRSMDCYPASVNHENVSMSEGYGFVAGNLRAMAVQ